ncbi:methyltransferase, partial [bacterium]|nr:methyltransferase [bacterium]
FQDSLMLIHARDISNSTGVVDIGSGGGLPGIPLALALPNLPVTLIEVSQKKIAFLEQTVKALELHNVTIFEYDWRTFLKTTTLPIQYLCARASLPVKELGRAFKPSSPYKDSTLVYWASRHWQMPNNLPLQIEHQANYVLIGKERNLAFIKPKA